MLIAVVALVVVAWYVTRPIPSVPVIYNTTDSAPPRSPSVSSSDAKVVETTLVAARPEVVRTDGYLGSNSCKECHEDYHQSWHTSYHRTMTQLVTPESAPAAIGNSSVVVRGERFVFSRRDDEFFVELNDPIANGQRKNRRLVMMTGSHHMHVFWYESGVDKTPAQLPILYLIDQQKWIPRTSAFLRPPNMESENELGRWNAICCNCHSTHPRTRPEQDQMTWDTRIADFGIACEACHGPGEGHVAFHQSKRVASEATEAATSIGLAESTVAQPVGDLPAKDPIVNPMDLPTSSRSDMCGQCHGMMMVNIDNAADQEQFFEHGRRFRPGDRLSEAYFLRVVRASKEHRDSKTFREFDSHAGVTDGHFWPDGELRVTGRDYSSMIESKCFQQGELSCMSCHTMHQQELALQNKWKDDQLKPTMHGDAACLQCHPKYKELGTEHTHHAIDSDGSRCMNCHMPHTVYGILKTSRSHTITSPSVATTIATGRPNACNLCHLDHTLEETSNHLSAWYGHDKPPLTDEQRKTAASLLHFLSGDAAQRVLQMSAFQWKPAQEAAGTQWMRLYVLLGMEDPYDAIRLIAERAYKSLPEAPKLDYDFLDSNQVRASKLGRQYQQLLSQPQPPNDALMIDEQGMLDQARFEGLIMRRNNRPVYLQE